MWLGLSGGACRNRLKTFDISQDHWHIMLLQPLNTIAARTLSKFSAKAQPQSWKHVSPRAEILKHVRVPLCLITLAPSVVNDRRSDLHVRTARTCAFSLIYVRRSHARMQTCARTCRSLRLPFAVVATRVIRTQATPPVPIPSPHPLSLIPELMDIFQQLLPKCQ